MLEADNQKQSRSLYTCGALFPDGTVIELLSDGRLALWQHGEGTIATQVQCQGSTFNAMPLDPTLEKILQLPTAIGNAEAPDSLVGELSAVIRAHSEVDEEQGQLIAGFVLSTWLVDCLPSALCLNLWGPAATARDLVDLVCGLCRHPLPLNEVRLAELLKLPEGLCPTIVLSEPDEAVLDRILASQAHPQGLIFQRGRPLRLRCSTVVYSRYPIQGRAISVALNATGKCRKLTRADLQQVAEQFRPRLLRYRVSQHLSVAQSDFDAPEFAPATRGLARSLGAALAAAPENRQRVLKTLAAQDESEKSEHAQGADAVVVEALLAICHESDVSLVRVGEIAKLANGIFLGRGENRDLSPKAVGYILRRQLGFSAQRSNLGYVVELSMPVRARIHRVAAGYHVLSMLAPNPDCSLCNQILVAQKPDVQISSSPSASSSPSSQVEGPETQGAQT